MNIGARIRQIEQKFTLKKKHAELIVITERNGKFYQEQDGQSIEVPEPIDSPDKLIVTLTNYSEYEMQEDIKQ